MEEIAVRLPDDSTLTVPADASVEDVAFAIGPGLGRDTIAGVVDGVLVDRSAPVTDGASVEIVTEQSETYLQVLRHSAAHVFAQALLRQHPDARLAIGPPTDEGFYYDVDGVDLSESELRALEAEMDEIIAADYPITRELIDREELRERYASNPYKLDILETEAAGEDPLSVYTQAEFSDLCQGPHVGSTGAIGAVALLEISSAYWRGDEANPMLTRVYGTAFRTAADLEVYLEQRAAAAERDHRKLGRELDLFSIAEVTGPGLPLYHPNGKRVLNALEGYADELNEAAGYDPTETPHLFRTELWKVSGHYDNYADDMFLLDVNDEEYGLKPMNCPGHATIYDQHAWSYRDLPVRYYENGKVYRREQRGELSGLSRVWAFTIDDGHIFCRPDQIEDEVEAIMGMIEAVLETFGLDAEVALATRPERSVGGDAIWAEAEDQLRRVLDAREASYTVAAGDGAFYGPKIDFAFTDALGRRWDGPTVQLDFNMPERFGLTYTGSDNTDHQPVMIHRALYGSYERFFMVLIEHFDGRFPLWLAPEQVRVLPITDEHIPYAESVAAALAPLAVTVEDRSWTLGRKIREAQEAKVPFMLIVGDDEVAAETVSVRDRQEREVTGLSVETVQRRLQSAVSTRALELPVFEG
ncbi:MAG: threonine--tRNA ligase [Haloquadratum sp.]|jgi:threonyl-tRNA synthetase|nr:threonine--tRNA ligase [Haloferacaceae archaeon]MDR9445036.1 threonine--tRNA ligase [Haloquadratum sp.]